MGLTHTRLRLLLVHEKLVTCTKQTPEPLEALSAAYPMNSGAEKEPREETNPHRKPSGRKGRKTSVFPCTVASASTMCTKPPPHSQVGYVTKFTSASR